MTTLARLATEDGMTEAELVVILVTREDEARHAVWDRTARKFVRRRCPRPSCQECKEQTP